LPFGLFARKMARVARKVLGRKSRPFILADADDSLVGLKELPVLVTVLDEREAVRRRTGITRKMCGDGTHAIYCEYTALQITDHTGLWLLHLLLARFSFRLCFGVAAKMCVAPAVSNRVSTCVFPISMSP